MKFKDNIFYKAVAELKEKNNNFKPKRKETDFECTRCFYDFDIGMAIVAARLLELILNNNRDYVAIELDINVFDDKIRNNYSPNEAFEALKDIEVNDLGKISFTKDLGNTYFSDTFFFNPEKGEVECLETYHDTSEDPDEEEELYGSYCYDPYFKYDMHDDLD